MLTLIGISLYLDLPYSYIPWAYPICDIYHSAIEFVHLSVSLGLWTTYGKDCLCGFFMAYNGNLNIKGTAEV